MKRYGYFNGKIMALNKIRINPYDLGFLRGYGVFDVMRTQGNKPFLFEWHWKRFQDSAKRLNLKITISKKECENAIKKLLKLNGFKKATIRIILTGGASKNGFSFEDKETLCILIEKFFPLPQEFFKEGASVITFEYLRDMPKAKITNYIAAIKMQEEKKKKKALEIIYTHKGKALEASTSNFFIVKKGKLITPKENILLGITRNLVADLAKKNGFKIQEREIKISELFSADEVFLTASNKDIVPIVKVDGKKIADGKVGKATRDLMDIFKNFSENY